MKNPARCPSPKRQTGAAIVEFAIIGALLLAFIYAIFEFGRMMFVYNTMQEISRRGAREATVRWVTDGASIKNVALFGATNISSGIQTGVLMWVGFVITSMIQGHRYEGAPWSRTLIDGGYLLAVLVVQGLIIGIFG